MKWLRTLLCFAAMTAPAQAGDPAGRLLEKEIVLPVPRAEAWHYWTSNEGFQKSVGVQGSNVELKLGGKYEIYFSLEAPAGQRGSDQEQSQEETSGVSGSNWTRASMRL